MNYLFFSRYISLYPLIGLLGTCVQALHPGAFCNSSIYCTGELLHTVQMAKIFTDSKSFVDLKLLGHEEDILACFQRLMADTANNPNRIQLMNFLDQHFEDKDELRYWNPPDFVPTPPFLFNIRSLNLLVFAKDIINIWPMLGRRVSKDVAHSPEQYSFIYVPNGFIIPGGRFKELYYWDSYWIIRGLLISNMMKTAKGMIENFLHLVQKYGYVPNGSRIYYFGRSQPPLLTWMVYDYFHATGDKTWLRDNIAIVEKELKYWLHKKKVMKVKGIEYKLLRYSSAVASRGPRPEAYYEDFMNGRLVPAIMRERFYAEIKTAAESGWDFSSRWITHSGSNAHFNLTDIKTSRIIPVDLNSIFAGALQKMGDMKIQLFDKLKAKRYWSLAKQWRYAIDKFMWDPEDGTWYDFDSHMMARRKQFFLSCAAPLWAGAVESWHAAERAKQFVRYLHTVSVLKFPGGVPASLWETGEQWDFPNAWPPLQSMLIGGLDDSNCNEAKRLAKKLAKTWVHSNYMGYKKTQKMFEKYNCLLQGEHGDGGEYLVQNGFGWTNGFLLELIQRYGDDLDIN